MPQPKKSDAVGVVGAGTMGAGIAQVIAAAGYPVVLFDMREGAAQGACDSIHQRFESMVTKGKLSEKDAVVATNALKAAGSVEDLAPCRLVIEAIVEDLEVKRKLFAQLEALVGDDALLATNTSSLSVTALAATLKHPQRVVGLHFFNPAPLMPLVEVIHGMTTSQAALNRAVAWTLAWNKHPIRVRSAPGFVVNRVARPFYGEGLRLLDEGIASVATLDTVLRESGGFRMGPCQLSDLIGQDINFAVTSSMFEAFHGEPRYTPTRIQQDLVEAGYYGRKSGRGFYDYTEGAQTPLADTAVPCPAPASATVYATPDGHWQGLLDRAQKSEITLEIHQCTAGQPACVEIGGTLILPSDGRSATEMSNEMQLDNLVVLDLALDYASAERVCLAASDLADDQARQTAAGFFQALGYTVSWVDDLPGLIVTRIVAQLINEALEAHRAGIATPEEIDDAMRLGANHPRGPFAWLDKLGAARVWRVLNNLREYYGEERYRPSPALRRRLARTRQIF